MEAVIHIDDQLFARAQQLAVSTGQTVDAVVVHALEETLERQEKASPAEKYCFPRDRGMGVLPGVNIDNSAELLDIMEEGLDVSRRR
jgi:hypothetical protein